jgi:hypothetical protein
MRLPIFAALGVIIALAGTPVPAPAQPADRATDPSPRTKPPRKTPPRTEGALPEDYYRHCVGGYAIEHRASGDTVVPRLRCWWARGK